MMEMNASKLANKIRVVTNKKNLERCPENRLHFYSYYASTVSKTLKKPLFQKFLQWIMSKENIKKRSVTDIQVRLFPFRKKNGRSLAGRCKSNDGIIIIFPKQQSFLQKKLQKHKKEKVSFYLKSRAMASLIHELLHIKYKSDERKVQHLTKKYFSTFVKYQNHNTQNMSIVQNRLFRF
jgi:hypothetical protein